MRRATLAYDCGPDGDRRPPARSSHDLTPVRVDRHELAGGLADLGVMIPLACGVAATAGLSLVTVFAVVALTYASTALAFRTAVPVQPMKAMAASIIALGLSAPVVRAASLEIGLVFLLLALTPLAGRLGHLFPRPVVRGVQLALGVLLLRSALNMAANDTALAGMGVDAGHGGPGALVGLALALAIAAYLIAGRERRRVPGGLVVLGAGAAVSAALVAAGALDPTAAALPPRSLGTAVPSLNDAWVALVAVVLPQLPLSLGNSVFATDDALHHYYGRGADRVSPPRLCLSLGLVNVVTSCLGGMALCHGAGGATAHYRLGARTAGATLLAAGFFLALASAVMFGLSPVLVPGAVLAGMLLFVAVEHCLLVTDLTRLDDLACALLIAVVTVVTGNLALGFFAGWAGYLGLKRSPLRRVPLRWPALTARLAPPPNPAKGEAV
jgi:SulP family sulfate permease